MKRIFTFLAVLLLACGVYAQVRTFLLSPATMFETDAESGYYFKPTGTDVAITIDGYDGATKGVNLLGVDTRYMDMDNKTYTIVVPEGINIAKVSIDAYGYVTTNQPLGSDTDNSHYAWIKQVGNKTVNDRIPANGQQHAVTKQYDFSDAPITSGQIKLTLAGDKWTNKPVFVTYNYSINACVRITLTEAEPEVVSVPVINQSGKQVSITDGESSYSEETITYYTTDGSEPNATSKTFTEPFQIDTEVEVVKAYTVSASGVKSEVVSYEVVTGKSIEGFDTGSNQMVYTGNAFVPTLKDGDIELVLGEDFTVSYATASGNEIDEIKAVGNYTITYTGEGFYGEEMTKNFQVFAADFNDILIAEVADTVYNGKAIEPKVKVLLGDVEVAASEVEISYENNINVGKGQIILKSTGENFSTGTILSFEFNIVPKSLGEGAEYGKDITVDDIADVEYTGEEQTPAVTVKYGEITLTPGADGQDNDYTVSYKNNVEVGTATVTIEGWGNYSGSITKTFAITEATGISRTQIDANDANAWFDISGRKLLTAPTKKGVYIRGGKKVVVK